MELLQLGHYNIRVQTTFVQFKAQKIYNFRKKIQCIILFYEL